uniref:Uncharacterized protein n=1 Tax=Arundo donax TaxID=35708 RepID=A0A0A9E9R0_ARUDO
MYSIKILVIDQNNVIVVHDCSMKKNIGLRRRMY